MASEGTARRRWIGGLVLLGAIGMLIAGETMLDGRMGPVVSLIYWLGCTFLTCVALRVAFKDMRAQARRIQVEQRALLETTLKEIEAEARTKPRPSKSEPSRN